jgi:hypothetical protein
MTDADLADFFAATEAPAHDDAFELAVEEAVARRRLAVAGAGMAVLAGLMVGFAWLLWPAITAGANALVTTFDPAGPTLAVLTAAIAGTLWFSNWMSGERPAEDWA